MAKKKKRSSTKKKRGGGSQRVKFKKAALACQKEVRDAGITAFSKGPKGQFKTFGRCMSKKLK